jgi:hypothetical protein
MGSGKRLLRRPKLSTWKFSAWRRRRRRRGKRRRRKKRKKNGMIFKNKINEHKI